ncbi:MAG: exodeoxyribonuclease V subunit gamma [Fibromonadales bacterium]|nr:exodeoxyribonuclease V subunit gamma [Fibromonadales bacterium]
MRIIPHTDIEILADAFIEDVLNRENFAQSHAKGGFLTGGKMLVCESDGLQEYLLQRCVDEHGGIWTALQFKPLAGLLMQCAYNLSPKDMQEDEKNNVYNPNNLVWAIYNLLPEEERKFSHASEMASLFFGYQIYRPELIQAWTNGSAYEISESSGNFINNEKRQRKLWNGLEAKFGKRNISSLYKFIETALKNPATEKNFLPKQIFIFAPLSIAPIHLRTLALLSKAGCEVNLYAHQISTEYIGMHLSDKQIARNRKKSWENKIVNENELYWDLGNRLIANLGRSSQVFYEQILECGEDIEEIEINGYEIRNVGHEKALLKQIQQDIIADNNEILGSPFSASHSLTINNCFSPLREIEVLGDHILDLFAANKELTYADIAVVAPDIEIYASAIEMVFGRYEIPYKISDRNVKKYDKTAQLLNMIFSLIGSRYEASDVVALFEYSMFVQNKELDHDCRERLEKWVRENAIRHGLDKGDYSFENGFSQLFAGFFMISADEFSGKDKYCYPDIEGNPAYILGDFVVFVRALEKLAKKSEKKHSVGNWHALLCEILPVFFGKGVIRSNEGGDNSYQKVRDAWDSLQAEMKIGFCSEDVPIDFFVLKKALLNKMELHSKNSYSLSGNVSFSNIKTFRAVPRKIVCCIGMNSKEFPSQVLTKDISLIAAKPKLGDKDLANEERLIFLETLLSAEESFYISWVGQSEKTADDLEPSSVVVMLLKNLETQYKLEKDKIIVKHPLQPFSRKYFEKKSNLSTYDARWEKVADSSKSVWQWEPPENKDNDIDDLYVILSDAPKYFLKNVCKIELPEDIDLLDNLEPFVVERGLDEWQLMQWVLDGNMENKIRVEKLRGKLPTGNFADRIIEKLINEAKDLNARIKGETLKYLAYPSNDKGKYRLKHWLFHLDLNSKETQDTKIFLRNKTIALPGMATKTAEKILDKLRELKQELNKKMRPIFPGPAFDYYNSKRDTQAESAAEFGIFGDKYNAGIAKYSPYAKKFLGAAGSFEDFKKEMGVDIKQDFKDYSVRLFENYNGKEEGYAGT